jgi:hypothetical protein
VRQMQIIDLDGCIADDRWRRGFIGPKEMAPMDRFHEYHIRSVVDPVVHRTEVRDEDHAIIVITARPVLYADQTWHWLRHYANIDPLHIIFRNNNDHRHSADVKRTAIEWLLSMYDVAKEEIVDAIDDCEDVLAMYREFQLPARLVRIGEDEHVF